MQVAECLVAFPRNSSPRPCPSDSLGAFGGILTRMCVFSALRLKKTVKTPGAPYQDRRHVIYLFCVLARTDNQSQTSLHTSIMVDTMEGALFQRACGKGKRHNAQYCGGRQADARCYRQSVEHPQAEAIGNDRHPYVYRVYDRYVPYCHIRLRYVPKAAEVQVRGRSLG
jgi:hypothetical protein